MRAFLLRPFVLHVLIAGLTVGIVVANQRLGLGLDQNQINAVIAGGVALIVGKSFHDAAQIVGDAHVDATQGAAHIAAGNNPDGSPKT